MSLEEVLSSLQASPEVSSPVDSTLTLEPQLVKQPTSETSAQNGLTGREKEVLQLLASGLTNIQIADQLVISPRTVQTHLSTIYAKLGVATRSAATRYALEHHLA
ncbi:response regulator transcription factor [Dictyobacter vulcani]|nr:response regulator transcription factor [Dictyobacter vulcani]